MFRSVADNGLPEGDPRDQTEGGLNQQAETDDRGPDAEDRPAPAALQRTEAPGFRPDQRALIVRSLRR
jgi:hypothetical protein